MSFDFNSVNTDEVRQKITVTRSEPVEWQLLREKEYRLTAYKTVKKCTFNLSKWLVEAGIINQIYYDEFFERHMIILDDGSERPLSDIDILKIIQTACLEVFTECTLRKTDISDAIEGMCIHRNPVKELIQSLKWDGIPRAETLLIDKFGVDDNAYTRAVVPLFVLGIISRIFNPGAKYDYMLVFQGDQGCGKTTFFQKMSLNDKWYTAIGAADIADKKLLGEKAQGKLILEYEELDGIRKTTASRLKANISGREDNFRAAYDRYAESRSRKYVLAGTTNEPVFLSDPTGSRRYLPIPLKKAYFLDAETAQQVYAEMYQVYLSGDYQLYLSKEVDAIANIYRENVTSLISDDFIENINYHLETYIGESTHVTPWDVWHNLSGTDDCFYGIPYNKARPAICQALERLGWKFKAAKEPKCRTVVRAYWRPTDEETTDKNTNRNI